MGTARTGRDRRDLSKYETLYEDPEYERLRALTEGSRREMRRASNVFAGGSTLETVGGFTALIVAIIGFSSLPFTMASIATIAIGVALFSQGTAIMARWHEALRRLEGARYEKRELASGVSTEMFGGLAGLVMGMLALVGVKPLVLLPVCAIVFGTALLLGGAAQPDLVYLAPERNPKLARMTYSAIQTSGAVMILVGIAAVVLGILAVLHVGPILTLTLVALMAIGVSLVFAGGALTARFIHRFTPRVEPQKVPGGARVAARGEATRR
jgi:hypothetical protein